MKPLPDWRGRTVACFASGPSLTIEDCVSARDAGCPTIVSNTTYRLTPWADALYAHDATGGQHIDPGAFKLDRSVDMLVMIIFGGLGSITGAVLGGVAVALSLELLREFHQYRLVLYAVLLIGLMLLRPQGLLGTRELSLTSLRRALGVGRPEVRA